MIVKQNPSELYGVWLEWVGGDAKGGGIMSGQSHWWLEWVGGDAKGGGIMSGQSHWLYISSLVWATDYAGLAIAQAQAAQGAVDSLSGNVGRWVARPAIIGPDGKPVFFDPEEQALARLAEEGKDA